MLIHVMIGALVLALACFAIGLLASRPSLLRRERRPEGLNTASAADTQPLTPTRIQLRPASRRVRMRIGR